MTDTARLTELVRGRGYERREEPFLLASGQRSHDYIDGKYALSGAAELQAAAAAAIEAAGVPFDAVGGPTMGADALAHAVCLAAGCEWFSVRKEPKGRGRDQWIEGARLNGRHRVLLVEDVVTTGGSLHRAAQHVRDTAASVVAVVTFVDRGESAAALFTDVPYRALVTYRDLGIEPVGPPSPS